MPDTGKKSKWGLGGMLHKDRPNASTDSTYGSDIDSLARDSYGSGSAPSLTNSEPSLQPNQHINNQGQVVTTTTTTTTTITTGAGGQSETSGPHSSNLANKMDPRVNSSSDQTEVSEVSQRRGNDRPSIPQKSVRREPSPQPPPQQQHSGTGGGLSSILTGGRSQRDRSPNYEETSSPTGRHNFSYPSRAPPNGNGQVQSGPMPGGSVQGGQMGGGQQQPSTLQNLKTAAVGIHGVGETLRGTFNSGLDKHTGAPPERMAAHSLITSSGRQEIEQGRLSDASRAQGGINPKGILRKSGGKGQLRVVNE